MNNKSAPAPAPIQRVRDWFKNWSWSNIPVTAKHVRITVGILALLFLVWYCRNISLENFIPNWGSDEPVLSFTNGVTILKQRPRATGNIPSIDVMGSTNVNIIVSYGDAPITVGAPSPVQISPESTSQGILSVGEKISPRPLDVRLNLNIGEYIPVKPDDESFPLKPNQKAILHAPGKRVGFENLTTGVNGSLEIVPIDSDTHLVISHYDKDVVVGMNIY